MACSGSGTTRDDLGELYSAEESCGNGGSRTVSYRDRTRERCDLIGEQLLWHVVSTTQEVQSRGACKGEYCILDGGSHLNSGSSTTITSGQVKVPLVCGFGEEGFFTTYNQLSDKACKDGVLTSSNTRQGSLVSQDQCPTYNYVATDTWTTCSADCGGQQTRISECRSNTGAVVDGKFCAGKTPSAESRVCDGNPDAVKRSEQAVTQQEGGSSNQCPKNQLGVVVSERDVTTTSNYACIDHKVQLAGQTVTNGAWKTESYCRDYVAHRCSQDSLDNSQALGRYNWMKKCQDQVPLIKEFLTDFDKVQAKEDLHGTVGLHTITSSLAMLYPTFMNHATNPEKPWIAPTKESASCAIPSTVYIAAVCVSSCATPEQEILVEVEKNKQMKYTTFIDALTRNYGKVATLASADSMSSTKIRRTTVQQWVTELLDTDHVIIEFRMKSGRMLKLTPNHPLLAADGAMKQAGDFKVGDSLVQLGGQLDEILSADQVNYFGKVYNLFVQSTDLYKNVVITNGYLNGTAYFQNAGTQDLNRNLFKNNLTQGVFSK
jgi:hypothetical protein